MWRHDYKACAGLRQSPINIDPDEVEYDKTLKPFKFHNYDKQFRWNVSHNGHTGNLKSSFLSLNNWHLEIMLEEN